MVKVLKKYVKVLNSPSTYTCLILVIFLSTANVKLLQWWPKIIVWICVIFCIGLIFFLVFTVKLYDKFLNISNRDLKQYIFYVSACIYTIVIALVIIFKGKINVAAEAIGASSKLV